MTVNVLYRSLIDDKHTPPHADVQEAWRYVREVELQKRFRQSLIDNKVVNFGD